jgi:hypothetical protein
VPPGVPLSEQVHYCPLTGEVMDDPWITRWGETFEKEGASPAPFVCPCRTRQRVLTPLTPVTARAAIVAHIRMYGTDPSNGKPLLEDEIYCNQNVKNIIRVRCVVDPAPPGVAPDDRAVTRDDHLLSQHIDCRPCPPGQEYYERRAANA